MFENINKKWIIRFLLDCVLFTIYSVILDQMVDKRKFLSQHRTCIPAYTRKSDGSFLCGDVRDPHINQPFITLSIGSPESFALATVPFMILVPFNFIWYYLNKFPKNTPHPFIWLINVIRILATTSGISTIIIHLLKYIIGLPRPNTYSILDREGYPDNVAFESFPSGHTSICFTICYVYGVMAQNALDYSLKENHETLIKKEKPVEVLHKPDEEEKFRGDHFFFLPLWNLLKFIPGISYILVWSPMVGATYVAITRMREYWHTDVDCVAGALIGIAIGHISYKRYYYDFYYY